MELEKNRIPNDVKRIHLIAVCGTGMGALACMLKDKGYQVSGSDNNIYPPMSTFLEEKEIALSNGFDETNLSHCPDLVVVGNAVTRDNPEAIKMQQMELCYCSMPQAVNRFMVGNKKSLVVTGTHGKTTTASILAWILESAGLQPSYMIGGIVNNFNSNYRLGNGDYFIIEGDEYDTAFFDKGPKFLHYRAHTLIITGIEFDHADIFNDLDHIKQAFAQLISSLPKDAALVGCSTPTSSTCQGPVTFGDVETFENSPTVKTPLMWLVTASPISTSVGIVICAEEAGLGR